MRNRTENMVAEKIVEIATNGVKNSVGKCWPLLAHEVEMPECVRQEFMGDLLNEEK